MVSNRILGICLCFLLILCGQSLIAQILTGPDRNIEINSRKGIILLYTESEAFFYLNNQFLTNLIEQDTLFMINVNPGRFYARFKNDRVNVSKDFLVEAGSATKIIFRDSLLEIIDMTKKWNEGISKIRGKKYLGLLRMKFYNITQIGVLNIIVKRDFNYHESDPDLRSFNYFSTVNGFQFAPGFCLGIGVAYTFYDLPVSWYAAEEFKNVSFMPLYIDIRSHFPQKGRVVPFFKFDMGYNVLLTHKSLYQYNPYNESNYVFKLESGGIRVSPGFGYRIIISELIQVIASVEYSFEKLKIATAYSSTEYNYFHFYDSNYKNHFIRFTLGIGFQY